MEEMRPRRRWVNNIIKNDLKEVGYDCWIKTSGGIVNTVMKLRIL
jgi:hypothetical protein